MQRPVSLLDKLAGRYSVDGAKLRKTIEETVMPKEHTLEDLMAFAIVADKYDLNPFLREIFAYSKKTGGIQVIVGVDGWAKILNREDSFDGMEFDHDFDDKGKIISVTCRLYRKDRSRPTEVTEFYAECVQSSGPWQKWPIRMLRHKALAQAARYGFAITDVIDQDEAERHAACGVLTIEAQRDIPRLDLNPDATSEPKRLTLTIPEQIAAANTFEELELIDCRADGDLREPEYIELLKARRAELERE